jgi:SET domain-containing protein
MTRAVERKIKGARFPLTVKKSRISGQGVFAVKAIPWGMKIIEFRGTVISDSEAEGRAAEGATAIMELGEDRNVDGFAHGNGAALINHGRQNANCCLLRDNGRVWIIAGIEGVEVGAELTYDYGSDYYPRRRKRA